MQTIETKKMYLKALGASSTRVQVSEIQTVGSHWAPLSHMSTNGLEERHCRLEIKPEGVIIRDLRSQSGTFVNGARINEAWIQIGDSIKMGQNEFILLGDTPTEESPLKSKNEKWNKVLARLPQMARTEFPVLILGPSGAGKEQIAETLHKCSNRAQGSFVRVNCGAFAESLIESELFGHIKGSFTGAINDRKGAFESARGGTLFLDEIGDLPYALQAKLLRALENNEIRPVGGDRTISTDVRIVAATHQNLGDRMRAGSFRNDLFYRLNVLSVQVPALEQRMEDFDDILYSFAKQMRVRFSFDAIQRMKRQAWPGQIRELRNLVSRAAACYPFEHIEEALVEELITAALEAPGSESFGQGGEEMPVIKEIEKQMIVKRLQANKGNQRRTASDLGMPKSTLHDRLKTYGIDPSRFSC